MTMRPLGSIVPIAHDERIVMVLRHHWIVFAGHILLHVGFALLLPFMWGLLLTLFPQMDTSQTIVAIAFILTSSYYLALWVLFFNGFINYYLDMWVVTTKRIMDVEQHTLFRRTIAEQPLSRVQDITSDIHGVLATFLHYGDIVVQSAGTKEKFIFHSLPHPELISRTILELVEQGRPTED